jgi:Na+-transporting methylmalonyl-CoA/oxaloacetate decarboxylase gamma subunit
MMLIGLAGVFAVLIIFYIVTRIMLKVAININKKKEAKAAAAASSGSE